MKYILLFGAMVTLLFSSCASLEESGESSPEPDPQSEEEPVEAGPEWYDHANRAVEDSTSFTGFGLAAAADSASAHAEARKQAVAHLKVSIDRYAENVRRERADDAGGEKYDTPRFILDLRNAVQQLNLDSSLALTVEHVEKEGAGAVHNIYIRASMGKQEAFSALEAALGNAEFVSTVRESASR